MSDPAQPTVTGRDPFPTSDEPDTRVGELTPTTGEYSDCDLTGQVAGYQILSLIARGGMGAVYRALDVALQRTVAVKVVQHKYLGSRLATARFLEEARITAQLQHPGIPPVHQVGTLPDGRPFLAMKLIKGRTLAELIKGPEWSPAGAAGIFEQVCHAVAYAHEHGVIHRDLKPQNVMVGRFNEVQVMDWGLARLRAAPPEPAHDGAGLSTFHDPRAAADSDPFETRAGSILGTPAYMPPEQAIGAVGQVTERSDVFSLGAVLCAMLTGEAPYVGTDNESTRQMAARARLDGAYARLAACGADPELAALSRRCLSPEPDDRPAHAGEVAKAVAALRAAADERARAAEAERVRAEVEARAQRKRRGARVTVAAAVVALAAVGGAAGWYADRQATLRRAADRERVGRNADALAALVGQCEAALRDEDGDAAATALAEVDRRLPEGGGDELAARIDQCRRDLAVTKELDAVDTFRWASDAGKLPADAEVVARWRAVLTGYGVAAADERAAATLRAGLVRDRLLGVLDAWLMLEPTPWAGDLLRQVDPDEFRDAARAAAAAGDAARLADLAGRPAADDQPPRFASALGQHPALAVGRRRELARAALARRPTDLTLLMVLGKSYPINQRAGAEERARWFQAAVAARPGSAAARNALGIALADQNDLAGAVAAYREAIRLDPRLATAHNNLGAALKGRGDLPGAVAAYREAIRLAPRLASAHHNLGLALKAQHDLPAAVAAIGEAVRLEPADASFRYSLGNALNEQGDHVGAAAAYREAARLDPADARTQFALGDALRAAGAPGAAADAYREAVRIDPGYALAHVHLGIALADQGDWAAAIAAYRRAIRIDPEDAGAHRYLGLALVESDDLRGAAAAFREAIRLDPKDSLTHLKLGVVLADLDDLPGAVAAFREAARLDPTLPVAHLHLGEALREQGDLAGAVAALREAVRLDDKQAPAHYLLARLLATGPAPCRDGRAAVNHARRACELTDWQSAQAIDVLAAAHAAAGEFDKAVEFVLKALADADFDRHDGKAARSRLQLYREKKPYYDPLLAPREKAAPQKPGPGR